MKAEYFIFFSIIMAGNRAFGQSPNAIFLNASIKGDIALAAKGDVTATTRLGYRYLTGSTGAIDAIQAYQYLSTVAPKSAAALAWVGYAAATKPELAVKGVNGVALVRQASNAGDPVGMTLLGRLYHLGKGVPQNTATAQQLYTKAAPDFVLAQTFLGETYLESRNPAEHSKALNYFLSSAAFGDAQAMVQLAVMYTRGDGVTRNYANAAKWLDQAARRGDPVAIFQRGLLYFKGSGLPKSHLEAVLLYRKAAVAGYAPAQAELGVCYATGQGVTKDVNQAIHWLSMAAPTFPYAAAQLALVRQGKLQ